MNQTPLPALQRLSDETYIVHSPEQYDRALEEYRDYIQASHTYPVMYLSFAEMNRITPPEEPVELPTKVKFLVCWTSARWEHTPKGLKHLPVDENSPVVPWPYIVPSFDKDLSA